MDMVKRQLENLGYRVLCAATPGEAIRLGEENTGSFRLLMTDVIMPGMNGRDLARLLTAMDPKIKCLFMSGYTADIIASQGILDADVHFIQKPFSKEELAAKVRELLEQNGLSGHPPPFSIP